MQEEVEQRVVTLIVNCSKLTEQELRKALATEPALQMRTEKEYLSMPLPVKNCMIKYRKPSN